MALKHHCFISYRHSTDPTYGKLVGALCDALTGQISFIRQRCEVYRDLDRLKPGAKFQPELAKALCESSCMVLLFTPDYFNEAFPFCALEYLAMKDLEAHRSEHVAGSPGLIIPIVIRGERSLPREILDRNPVSLDRELLSASDVGTKAVRRKLRVVAEQIDHLHTWLHQVHGELPTGCNEFAFRTDADIAPWLRGVVAEQQRLGLPNVGTAFTAPGRGAP